MDNRGRRFWLALGACSSSAALFGVALTAPTLDWDDETADATPDFTIDFGPEAISGDVIRVQYDTDSGFSAPTEATDTLDSTEIAAGLISLALSSLSNGTYYVRARIERGGSYSDWSNTETITIAVGGGTAGEAIGLLLALTKAA